MNMILLFEKDFVSNNKVLLKDRRLAHVLEYYKVSAGSTLKVGLLNNLIGEGIITDITNTSLEMEIALSENPPEILPATLVLAMPRPKALKRIIQHATALGVKKIYIIKTWKVDKSYWETPVLTEENLQEQMILGLEQAKDTIMPEIQIRKLFKPFAEDELPEIIKDKLAILAHPYTDTEFPRNIKEPSVIAIGTDGGFIPYEVEMLEKIGFATYSLGARILRTDTAVSYILGRLY